jgi:hypothetical protein
MKTFVRILAGAALPLSLAAAQAAHAGAVYVPLPGVTAVGPVAYETQLTITNTLAQQRTLSYLQLGSGVDGTKRQGLNGTPFPVAANKSVVLKPVSGVRGLLELNGPPGLQYSARLVSVGTGGLLGLGVDLPVITSENMVPADGIMVLQGLKSSTTKATDVAIINLGKAVSSCTIKVLRADGTPAFANATISVPALSHSYFTNIFGSVLGGVVDARAEVTCSKDFYAYAQMSDSATGEVAIVTPAGSSSSSLTIPGDPVTGLSCAPAGTICYLFPGLVHLSSQATPARSLFVDPPVGTYSSVKLHFEVTMAGEFTPPASAAHGILYFVKNKNRDMFANIFLRGPGKDSLTLRHGFDQAHVEKAKLERPFIAQPNETYTFDYDYNPGARILSLRVSRAGQLLFELTDKPNVNRILIQAGDKIIIGLGNPGTSPDVEPPSYGWTWSNFKIEFYP